MEKRQCSWFLCTEVPQNPTLLTDPWQAALVSTVLLELSAHKTFEALLGGGEELAKSAHVHGSVSGL